MDWLDSIIKLDREAARSIDEAVKAKEEMEADVKAEIDAMRSEYMERARERIKKNEDYEADFLDNYIKDAEAEVNRVEERLSGLYALMADEWAEKIFRRVTESDGGKTQG